MTESEEKVHAKEKCDHCGDTCHKIITISEKKFCCSGCASVYELLKTGGLLDYYNIESKPGISPNKNDHSQCYI